ncbi:hypothetical protein FRC07_000341 [Ceratobasidium sp. 392]|nr:hypothetical protein FRC07_000341 [Ceratobasidium sp. 392]
MVADFNTTLVRRFKARESERYKIFQASKQTDIMADGFWPYITQEQQPKEWDMVVTIAEENTPTITRDLAVTPIVSKLPYRLATVAGPSVSYCDWMIDGNRLIGIKATHGSASDHFVVHYIND